MTAGATGQAFYLAFRPRALRAVAAVAALVFITGSVDMAPFSAPSVAAAAASSAPVGVLVPGVAIPAPLPADASVEAIPEIKDITCPAAGTECVAVGAYSDALGDRRGLLEFVHGVVARAVSVPSPVPGMLRLDHVECPDEDTCFAAGEVEHYDGTPTQLAFVQVRNGAPTASVVSMVQPTDPLVIDTGLSCPSVHFCAVAGSYADSDPQSSYLPVVATWRDGTWSVTDPPLPNDYSRWFGRLFGIDCWIDGACVATGEYAVTTGTAAWTLTLTDGSWTVRRAPLPARLGEGSEFSQLFGVSCSSEGLCRAIGTLSTPAERPFVDTLNAGTWTSEALPVDVGTNVDVLAQSISCPTAFYCAARLQEPSGNLLTGVVDVLTDSAWSRTSFPFPSPTEINGGGILSEVECPRPASCFMLAGIAAGPLAFDAVAASDANGWHTRFGPAPVDDTATEWGPITLGCSAASFCLGAYLYENVAGLDSEALVVTPAVAPPPSWVLAVRRDHLVETKLHHVPGYHNGWVQLGGKGIGRPAVATYITREEQARPIYFERRRRGIYSRTLSRSWSRVSTRRCSSGPTAAIAVTRLVLACLNSAGELIAAPGTVSSGHVTLQRWHDLGGHFAAVPGVAIVAGQARFVGRTSRNRLRTRTFNNRWSQLDGYCATNPDVATDPTRSVSYLTCRTPSRRVRYWTDRGFGYSHPRSIGGTTQGVVAAAATTAGLQLFRVTASGNTYQLAQDGWQLIRRHVEFTGSASALN